MVGTPSSYNITSSNSIKDVSIQVTILKKENMTLHFDSKTKRDNILNEIKAVAELATAREFSLTISNYISNP